ncbi:MAG: septum formation family protein [Acidimicrobiia bacterium]
MTAHLRQTIGFAVVAVALVTSACSGNVFSLAVGDCFDDWEGALSDATSEVTDVDRVDCDDPHDNEVYAVVAMDDGSFPGDAAVQSEVIEVCSVRFDTFVGIPYEDSRLDFGALFPLAESWSAGDRDITCFVYDIEFLKLTGTMRNAQI